MSDAFWSGHGVNAQTILYPSTFRSSNMYWSITPIPSLPPLFCLLFSPSAISRDIAKDSLRLLADQIWSGCPSCFYYHTLPSFLWPYDSPTFWKNFEIAFQNNLQIPSPRYYLAYRKICSIGWIYIYIYIYIYLPNPPLGQDMTQGQILSGV